MEPAGGVGEEGGYEEGVLNGGCRGCRGMGWKRQAFTQLTLAGMLGKRDDLTRVYSMDAVEVVGEEGGSHEIVLNGGR